MIIIYKLLNKIGVMFLMLIFSTAALAQISVKNPVINHDFPDPTVINANGKYYAYATNTQINGKHIHIQLASSTNLADWKSEGDALPEGAVWASKDYWAPHVFYDKDLRKYVMFYSAESKADDLGKCLGVAFADQPEGPFIDKGTPFLCGESFINIDPMVWIEKGKKYLFWGSAHKPIIVQELSDDYLTLKSGTTAKPVVFPSLEKTYDKLIEGAWLDYNNGYYYLYYSGDNCCGDSANYAVMVARAKNPLGPYQRLGEIAGKTSSVVLEKNDQWLAPGHNSIFKDAKGNIYIAYHAIRRQASGKISGGRVMLINRVEYRNGWPAVVISEE